MPDANCDTYLGDGVYAGHDGWQVWLAVNHHENVVVALDPHVIGMLLDYALQKNLIRAEAVADLADGYIKHAVRRR